MTHRIIIEPVEEIDDDELRRIVGPHTSIQRLGGSRLYVVELPGNRSAKAVAALLAHHPRLNFAEEDGEGHGGWSPNDPQFSGGAQWNMTVCNFDDAWDLSRGTGAVIAFVDSGIYLSATDFIDKIVAGRSILLGSSDTTATVPHGSATASIGAARTNDSHGMAGAAPEASIMPVVVLNSSDSYTWSNCASGITWATDNGADIINVSLTNLLPSSSIAAACKYAAANNVMVVGCAGNTGGVIAYPKSPNLVMVGGTNSSDGWWSGSSYGAFVGISAPSTYVRVMWGQDSYTDAEGTSFGAPLVAGTAALIKQVNPTLPMRAVQQALFDTAVDLGTTGKDDYYGHGRLDADAAVRRAMQMRVVTLDAGTTSWTVPAGVTTLASVGAWGAGGSGGSQGTTAGATGGGGGGAFSRIDDFDVTPGASISCQVPAGPAAQSQPSGDTWFGSSATVMAKSGVSTIGPVSGSAGTGGAGGAAASGVGTIKYSGGAGRDAPNSSTGGGGGGSASDASDGLTGVASSAGASFVAGYALYPGFAGGAGTVSTTGVTGDTPGGGSGGSGYASGAGTAGGAGAPGRIVILYLVPAIRTQPAAQSVAAGDLASFTVAHVGGTAVQWRRSNDGGGTWADISGATATTYSFTTVEGDDDARILARVTNADGNFTDSDAATLTVASSGTWSYSRPTTDVSGSGWTVFP